MCFSAAPRCSAATWQFVLVQLGAPLVPLLCSQHLAPGPEMRAQIGTIVIVIVMINTVLATGNIAWD